MYPELSTDLFYSIPSLPSLCSDIGFTGVHNGENEVLQAYFQYTKFVGPETQLLHFRRKISNQKKVEACSFLNNPHSIRNSVNRNIPCFEYFV